MSDSRILIVDDEKDILEMLEYTLRKEGYEVFKASNGEKGLELAEAHKPEIIILDIMMPGMDGIELCRELRARPDFQNTFIIILTARGEEYSEVAGFDAGADDYVVKPIKLRSLIKRLDAMQKRKISAPGKENEILEFGNYKLDRAGTEQSNGCRGIGCLDQHAFPVRLPLGTGYRGR